MIHIRDARPSQDEAGIAAVVNAFEIHPISYETVNEWLTHTATGRLCHRRVSVTENDEVTGYCVAVHETWNPEGQFYIWAGTVPERRGQGIGKALYTDAQQFLQAHDAETLTSEVRDNCPISQAFADRRGFKTDRHLFQSQLDLTAFDEAPYKEMLEVVADSGIKLYSLADFQDTPDERRRLFEINAITDQDVPGWTPPGLTFEEFNEWVYEAEWYRPEGQIFAADGDEWVGLSAVRLFPESRQAHNVHTGVVRAYRGRHIALALKLAAIRYARSHHADTMSTDNDALNGPMLALNKKLGYTPMPGRFIIHKN